MSLDHASKIVKHQTLTRDAFLGGKLTLSQPSHGFRAGMDSVLLGAAVRPAAATLLDLGAGAGTAALVALAHNPAMYATLVESDGTVAALAQANLEANGLAGRGRVLRLDVTAPGRVRADGGLGFDCFETVIANPPYFEAGRGTPPADTRATARQLKADSLDSWVKAGAAHAAPDGEVIVVYPAAALPELLAAFATRFGAVSVLPLLPRAGEPATRVLVRGIKGSRAPFSLLAARVLHEADGRGFRSDFDAIFRGEGRLVW
jgi:tRNA1(Val) A37 N6-methylase TrmN6